ncbi:META domain-containing protein [Massilibacteroides vaginae]|uniref:META domain-containing protein n=1 Tax=Massilibacteroides vaginae TaxID=1673718 RepID=UPI00159384A9|nr:META domain-containing protein [Massilibacteroides vaginae]
MEKGLFGILAMFVSVLLMASCGSSKQGLSSLISGRWNIAEVNGEKVTGEKTPFIEFNTAEGRVHGNAGCNNFNTAFKLDPSKPLSLKLLPAASTMMACPDMDTETKVMRALESVSSVKKAGSALQLLDKEGAVVYLLEKAL